MKQCPTFYTFHLFVVSILAGCGLFPSQPTGGVRHFVLSTVPCPEHQFDIPAIAGVSVEAASSLQTSQIMYQKSKLERGYYQYAFWIESVPDRLRTVYDEALACHEHSGVKKDSRVLHLNVRDFYHQAYDPPGEVIVKIDVSITDGPGGAILETTQVSSTVPVEEFSSLGAVQAFDKATHEVVLKSLQWLGKTATPGA